jgi:hypothetical protein
MVRLLELFNGDTGGAAELGYRRAGFTTERKRLSADSLDYLAIYAYRYDAVHVQPSCKGYTAGTRALRAQGREYPRQIDEAREALLGLPEGVLWVMENVGGARAFMRDPTVLCGTMFHLRARDTDGEELWLQRHRLFETNFPLKAPRECDHPKDLQCGGVYGAAPTDKWIAKNVRHGGYNPPRRVQEELMGVPQGKFTRKALRGAVPPAYTAWIGSQLLKELVK